jgi:glucose/mannose transport system permease protein
VTAALITINAAPRADRRRNTASRAQPLLAALPTLLVYFFGGQYFRAVTAGAIVRGTTWRRSASEGAQFGAVKC